MKIGLQAIGIGAGARPDVLRAVACAAEAAGLAPEAAAIGAPTWEAAKAEAAKREATRIARSLFIRVFQWMNCEICCPTRAAHS